MFKKKYFYKKLLLFFILFSNINASDIINFIKNKPIGETLELGGYGLGSLFILGAVPVEYKEPFFKSVIFGGAAYGIKNILNLGKSKYNECKIKNKFKKNQQKIEKDIFGENINSHLDNNDGLMSSILKIIENNNNFQINNNNYINNQEAGSAIQKVQSIIDANKKEGFFTIDTINNNFCSLKFNGDYNNSNDIIEHCNNTKKPIENLSLTIQKTNEFNLNKKELNKYLINIDKKNKEQNKNQNIGVQINQQINNFVPMAITELDENLNDVNYILNSLSNSKIKTKKLNSQNQNILNNSQIKDKKNDN